jgi:predicted nucleotide-binding protein (sugar kinase/HSP70/actin superfamily)
VSGNGQKSLEGRTLYIHPMTQAGARLLAAVYRSTGIDAHILPPSDERTLLLGAMYSSGEECFPEKITLGDYLKITEKEGFDPSKTAFLMPDSSGPCRFGQYWPLLDTVLTKLGLHEIMIVNPSSENGYGDSKQGLITFFRKAWVGLIAADILRKMLLKTRPYEKVKGTTDRVYEESLQRCERVMENPEIGFSKRTELLQEELVRSRDQFRSIDADYIEGKPLIAVIGEIFCRHNRFANENMLKKLEEHGAETWISDVGEWIFYTDWSHRDNLRRRGKRYSAEMAFSNLKTYVMKHDEHRLLKSFHEDFKGYEEPENVDVVAQHTENYLPATGALGEMALSLGKSGYCYTKGADGIVDISPFTCMNGIVSEAVYPSFSKDHDDIPCRVFYYDGVNRDLDRDIGIFMELVKGYMGRKKIKRVYPDFFRKKNEG